MPAPQDSWSRFFFSPSGRFNRARYWGATFLVYGGLAAYWLPTVALGTFDKTNGDSEAGSSWLAIAYVVLGLALILAGTVAHVFTTVKRFHDRDKAWPWYFIGFVPFIGGFWILIECGCMAGTRGRNRYGADPLNPLEIADVFDGPPAISGPGGAAAAEPRLSPGFGVTPADRLG